MKAEYIRACCANWLRYDRHCALIAFERGLHWQIKPDVIGITDERFMIEIEVKVSIADLRRDFKKMRWTKYHHGHYPRLFYYAVPRDLVEKARPIIPDRAGLMAPAEDTRYGSHRMRVVKRAPIDPLAKRASMRQMVDLVKHQSGTLCKLAAKVAKLGKAGRS